MKNHLSKNLLTDFDHPRHNPTISTRIREEKMGQGTLRIVETYVNGDLTMEVFTLESLAHVIGMPMSTVEGRYKRARLSRWTVPVTNFAGRPLRGFPYAMLDKIVTALHNPRAVNSALGSNAEPEQRQLGELVPTYYLNERYYTVDALVQAFGYSHTTIRNKLRTTGLDRRFINIPNSQPHGGRPRRAVHERHMPDVKLAVCDNVRYFDRYEKALMRSTGQLAQARHEVREAIVPHRPPAPGSLQAWDPAALAPAQPAVDPVRDDFSAEIEALGAELNALLDNPEPENAQDTTQPVQAKAPRSVADDMPQFDSMPTDEQADKAQREQEAATRRAMVPVQRQMLIDDVDEPTDEDLSDTCYALDLKGAQAKAFIESVREGRRNKWNDQKAP